MNRIAELLLRIRHRMLRHATTSVVATILLLAVTVLLAAACSSDGPAPEAVEPGQSDALGEWAIHIYAGEPGAAVRVDLPPPRVVRGTVATSPYARPGGGRARGSQGREAAKQCRNCARPVRHRRSGVDLRIPIG